MALIVETGAIVPNANSYVSETDIVAYAAGRAVTITTDDATKFGVIAMDYLSMFADKWLGTKVDPQDRIPDWPRANVRINCVDYPADQIPAKLIAAQCQLCIYQQSGVVLMPTSNGQFATKEQVGPLVTEYSEKIAYNSSVLPYMPLVDSLLAGLVNVGAFGIRTVRV